MGADDKMKNAAQGVAGDLKAAAGRASGTGPDESDLHNVQDDDAGDDEDRFDAG